MIVQETLADDGEAESRIAWESQSCDELRAIASRGLHAGDLYFGALKELERRAQDMEAALETQQAVSIARRREIVSTVMILLAAIIVAATARLLGY